jgi:plastocyanin domain-containing protein
MKITTLIISLLALGMLGFLIFGQKPSPPSVGKALENPTDQEISIVARGGYTPNKIQAKANLPAKLILQTQNTFDCSASIVIPKLSFQKLMKPSEKVEVDIPAQNPGTSITGLCSMGMYRFDIDFN